MTDQAPKFRFEPAPDLPGADTISKYGFGAIRRLVHRLWDVTVEGAENVPTDGPAIITPNHLSFCDSVFVPAALPRRVWAIGKGEYMDDWKTKHIFPAMGMIPVDRSGGDAAQVALDTAARVLGGGHLFMIYPEGTRSRSGHLHKGRTGAARLAIRCDAPVIPVGHIGTLDIQPPDTFMMKPNLPCTVRFGQPMRVEDWGDPADPRVLRVFTDAVMFQIATLSGQTYIDRYASKDDKPGQPAPAPASTSAAGPSVPKPVGRPAAPAPGAADSSDGPDLGTMPSRPKGPAPSLPPGRRPSPSMPPGRAAAAAGVGAAGSPAAAVIDLRTRLPQEHPDHR